MNPIKCIYKLTSPDNGVYIGQTANLEKRLTAHKNSLSGRRSSPRLSKSIVEFGFDSHTAEILAEFPLDVDQHIVDSYEEFCILQYKEAHNNNLNIALGKRCADESKQKISFANSGRTAWNKGRIATPEERAKLSIAFTGLKRPKSDEWRRKLSEHNLGKKLTEEAKDKISQKMKNKPWSESRRAAYGLKLGRVSV